MKKQSLLIIGANLAIVALLAVTATVLIDKGKDPNPQTDTRSSANAPKPKATTVVVKDDALQKSLDDTEKEIESVIDGEKAMEDETFPEYTVSDFE